MLKSILENANVNFPFKRIALKLSGEMLLKNNKAIDTDTVNNIAVEIAKLTNQNIEICLIIGGGNICRGINSKNSNIDRSSMDKMGMLATVINALAFENALSNLNVSAIVQSSISMDKICDIYHSKKALSHMACGRVLIFAAGIGEAYFSTDTNAVLRALEMNCDILLKGTKVEGVYNSDPQKNADAKFYNQLTYDEIINNNLRVMDIPAIALAKENSLPLLVFSMQKLENLSSVISGTGIATFVN